MKETLDVIKYLLKEIEDDIALQEEYSLAVKEAELKADEYNKNKLETQYEKYYWSFMKWDKPLPKKTFVKSNSMQIRRLCVKLYSE